MYSKLQKLSCTCVIHSTKPDLLIHLNQLSSFGESIAIITSGVFWQSMEEGMVYFHISLLNILSESGHW